MPICCKHYESVGAFPCRAGRARERRRNYEVARRERGCQSCAVCTRHRSREGCAARPETGGGTRCGLPPVGQGSLQRCSKLRPILATSITERKNHGDPRRAACQNSREMPERQPPWTLVFCKACTLWASMRSCSFMRLSALLVRALALSSAVFIDSNSSLCLRRERALASLRLILFKSAEGGVPCMQASSSICAARVVWVCQNVRTGHHMYSTRYQVCGQVRLRKHKGTVATA
jgi:hypothetical protein